MSRRFSISRSGLSSRHSRQRLAHAVEALESRTLLADAVLVKDITVGPDSSVTFADGFDAPAALGNKLIFGAIDDDHSLEPWVSDGTAAGTFMLKDINPNGSSSCTEFTLGNGVVFFAANDGNKQEIWRTDGTVAGTVKVTTTAITPIFLNYNNGNLFFGATSGMSVYALNTTSGTVSPISTNLRADQWLGNVGTSAVFLGQDNGAEYGRALWATNGGAPTFLADPDTLNTAVATPGVAVNGQLVFAATAVGRGLELYRTDGTAAGTSVLADLNPAAFDGSDPRFFTVVGNKAYFVADPTPAGDGDQIYQTDGTTVTPVTTFPPDSSGVAFRDLTNVNGTLYFTYGAASRRLYKLTSGTTATEVPLGANGGTNPGYLAALGSTVYFSGLDNDSKARLFQSDGSTITLVAGDAGTDPAGITPVGSTLFFRADDDAHGQELRALVGQGPKPKLTVRLKAFEENIGASDGVIDEGASVVFQAVPSEDIKGTTYRWDFDGNGAFVVSGKKPLRRYIDNLPGDAVRNVRVKITAPDGRVANATFPLVVKNVKPTIKITLPPLTSPGAFTPAAITVSDPGENDNPKVNIDWGDGTVEAGQVPIFGKMLRGHVYAKNDINFLEFLVRDKDGLAAKKDKTIGVQPFVQIDAVGIALSLAPGYLLGSGSGNNRVQIKKSSSQPTAGKEKLSVFLDNVLQQVIDVDPTKEIIQIFTGEGNDRVDIDADINTRFRIQGGDGNDTLRGGAGRDTLIGNGGSDSLDARGGTNTVKQ